MPFFTRFRLVGWVAVSFVVSNVIGGRRRPASAVASVRPRSSAARHHVEVRPAPGSSFPVTLALLPWVMSK